MKLDTKTVEKLIFNLQKPARYTGGELNRIVKDDAIVRMAICYPDLYEVGMSNHGIMILYDIANKMDGVSCERVFAVPEDFEKKTRDMNIPLYTLESYTPLNKLDVLGFNISHELLYTNILQVLDLGRIPIFSRDRDGDCPIVIAGGEAVSNPLVMSAFIDVFFIGDGEEGIAEILNLVKSAKLSGASRKETISKLGEIEGVYIPSDHKIVRAGGRIERIEGKKVRKRIYRSKEPYNPLMPLVPSIRIAQERAVIEVTRGCGNLCKFCHAGYYELPYREYNPDFLSKNIIQIINNSGYNELTLSSLSLSDYRNLTGLLNIILPELTQRGISISFPSLRVDPDTISLIEQVSDLRKASLTFAVESASEAIRFIANKRLTNEDLFYILEYVFNKGWRTIKLYFMIGLPGCDENDEVDAIVQLLNKINNLKKGKKDINVTISPFVPKPHTPFQYEEQKTSAYLNDAITRIKRGVPRNISIKNHNINSSLLEGLFARGDERFGDVICRSYLDGCRLDSWNEYFRFDIWEKNLNSIIPDWMRLFKKTGAEETSAWSMVQCGFEKLIEFKSKKTALPDTRIKRAGKNKDRKLADLRSSIELFTKKYEVKNRIRVSFSKQKFAKYIPHIDFIEIIKRSLRMINAPVSFTQGFNKRERISLGFPLPVGIGSISEMCDVDLYEEFDIQGAADHLNLRLPDGITVNSIRYLNEKESLMAITGAMEFQIIIQDKRDLENIAAGLSNRIDFIKETKDGMKNIVFTNAIKNWHITDNALNITIFVGNENSVRIDKVLLSLAGLDMNDFYKFEVIKLRQFRSDMDGVAEIF